MIFKNKRQRALEEFLNDTVEPLCLGLYKWRNKYYEVQPEVRVKQRHNWSGFIRQLFEKKTYMIREASNDNIRTYFPKIWETIEIERSIKLNPKLIQKGQL